MKKLMSLLLALCLMLSLVACGAPAENNAGGSQEETIEDAAWDELESLGNVQTENGVLTVTITVPADFVEKDTTQAELDEDAGEEFVSAKLNEDGSVTYKMTKKQHKAMLDEMAREFNEDLQELINDDDNAVTGIKHNKDYSQFDVTLSTEELGLTESFMTMAFYIYGGMYGLFAGQESVDVIVNYFGASGDLLETASSADMAE